MTVPSFSSLEPVTFVEKSTTAAPRACVSIDGSLYPIRSYQINKNAHGATNTASFSLPYAGNPDWTNQLFRGTDSTGQMNNSPVYVKIWAGFPPNPGPAPITGNSNGMYLRFYGVLDEYDPEDMDVTQFKCRSLAAPLTSDRITTAVQNLTTTQFLEQVCTPYDLDTTIDNSITPITLAKVYAQDFIVGLKNLIKWDVLNRASVFDDVDVWEDDGTIYYVHPWNVQTVVPNLAQSIFLQYGTNVKSFKPSHSPQFSSNIRVQVHSYIAKTRVSTTTRVQSVVGGIDVSQVIKTATAVPQWGTNGGTTTTYYSNGSQSVSQWSSSGGASSGSNAPISNSGLELYDFYLPNLTSPECQALTQAIWRQISQHEYQGTFELAMTPELLPLANIEARLHLNGYGMSRFNTEYWPRTMDETFEMAEENSDTAEGWTVKYNAVSHTLPLGAGV